jgi:hypothetical protein
MSEMLERVAKAIDPDAFAPRAPGHEVGKCPDCDAHVTAAMERARAVIEALREPTPDMLADEDVSASWRGCPTCIGLRDGWRTMIDIALKP